MFSGQIFITENCNRLQFNRAEEGKDNMKFGTYITPTDQI